jgi:hypothetical protein
LIEIEGKTGTEVDIPADLENEMAETEFKVMTGVTLADALRGGIGIVPKQAIGGWGDKHKGCALTTAAEFLKEQGFA